MAVRSNVTNVKTTLGDNYGKKRDGTFPDLTRFLLMASKFVDRVYTCSVQKGRTLDTTELTLLEDLLAAHFYQMSDEGYTQRNTSKAGGSFKGQWGMGLELTSYGQNAMAFDSSGCVVNIAKKQYAGVNWGGKALPDQLTYDERNG